MENSSHKKRVLQVEFRFSGEKFTFAIQDTSQIVSTKADDI